ncbi:TIGR04104 family putative zinc finger protein [Shouchella sp. JSM 1781072]|uniref:TIGR04104 family putative zinc finger protein n=1 Tax=Shouchella sp. JSM 1781072 TaxID=3344581 RepID=UPI0035C227AB
MNLPSCWSCNHSYSYKEAYACSFGRSKCPACKEKQYQTKNSFITMGIPIVLILLIPQFVIQVFASLSFTAHVGAVLILFIPLTLVLPFFYQFTNEDRRFD